jgi:hypothetical protein
VSSVLKKLFACAEDNVSSTFFINFTTESSFSRSILMELVGQHPWLPTAQMLDIKKDFSLKYSMDHTLHEHLKSDNCAA